MIASIALLLAAKPQIASAPPTESRLVSSVKVIQAGKPFYIALELSMPEGWHSYYINPGESGLATRIDWTLPPGFSTASILWPVPEAKMAGGVMGYVYSGRLWLLSKIIPPSELPEGNLEFIADAKWLLCSQACVPQNSNLRLKLRAGKKEVSHASEIPSFEKAFNRLPMRTLHPNVVASDKSIVLKLSRLSNDSGIKFYAADSRFFGVEKVEVKKDLSYTDVRVKLSEYASSVPERVSGILVVPGLKKGSNDSYWIDEPVQKNPKVKIR